MHIYFLAAILWVVGMVSNAVLGQTKTQEEVMAQIDLGVSYLSEKQHTRSIEELISASEVATQNNWHTQAFNATLNIGTNYFLMLDYGEAFQYYLQAYEIALAHLGPKQEMLVFNNVAVLYTKDNDEVKAQESFKKAYNIAKQLNEREQIGAYGINLALLGNKMGALDLADAYIEEALPLLKDSPNILLLGKIARAENLLLREQYSDAEKLALALLPHIEDLSLLKERITIDDRINVLLILAEVYEKQLQFEQALMYTHQARAAQKEIEGRSAIYNRLALLHSKLNDHSKAMSYKDSVVMATDSLYALKNDALFKSEKVKFQIQEYQHELAKNNIVLQRERQFLYSAIGVIILCMGFLIWMYKNNSLKHQQRKKIVELELEKEKREYLLMEKQHREKEALKLLEKERLKEELELKNRELTTRALYLSGKNDLIEEIVKSLSSHKQIATNKDIKKQINELKKHLKKDTQWDSFFVQFEEVNQGFLDKIRSQHPNLTPGDIRFITFLYMNLSYKEIASLLNITPHSCRKRKERIYKKMNIQSKLSLHTYLSGI